MTIDKVINFDSNKGVFFEDQSHSVKNNLKKNILMVQFL